MSTRQPGRIDLRRDILDRPALLRATLACAAGVGLFLYGYQGGRGPAFLGPGWLMVVGVALLGYGLLTLLRLAWLRRKLDLTAREIEQWGPLLTEATPDILAGIAAGRPVGTLAEELRQKMQIPRDITLKYVIALGRYTEAERKQGKGTAQLEQAGQKRDPAAHSGRE